MRTMSRTLKGSVGSAGDEGEEGEEGAAPKRLVTQHKLKVERKRSATIVCSLNGDPAGLYSWDSLLGADLIDIRQGMSFHH